MAKSHIAALRRAESRITRSLELDGSRLSRGVKVRLEGALKDVTDVIAIEEQKAAVPEGLIRLIVNIDTETAEKVQEMQILQKNRGGGKISVAETLRRAVALSHFIHMQWNKGRLVQTMNSNGKDRIEVTRA